MKTSRRGLLRGAAFTGVAAGAGALTACSETPGGKTVDIADNIGSDITMRSIAEAEKLQGISYTAAERAMMLEDLEGELEGLAKLRAIETPNALAPALTFEPRLPGRSYGSQKSELRNLATYAAALPDNAADIAFASVGQLGAWLRKGGLTSARLTEIYLSRIAQYGDQLECFITVTPELARIQAHNADQDFAKGRDRGPLHGIPYGLKDLFDTKGIPTTWGAAPYKSRIAETDAEIVRKLRQAGAVLLGKTSCGALAWGDHWFDGFTRNPWNVREGSGGSSAGSASATAAGLCGFSIGTETWGSIVSPSERCGTTGLRPTFGRVSRAGAMALCWSLDKVGPICRTVEDTALILAELNGFDTDDMGSARMGFSYDGEIELSSLTIGYVPQWFKEGDNADRAALDAVRRMGVNLQGIQWPELPFEGLESIVNVEAAAAFADLTLSGCDDELTRQVKNAWPNVWRKARFISAVDYVQTDRLRRRAMSEIGTAFGNVDIVIGPHWSAGVSIATNATGHPCLVMRTGFAQTKTRVSGNDRQETGETFRTPRGISLWADLYQDGKLVAFSKALEARLGVASERPPGF
jgi:Asp-tRNA(Asn)/Glu-tRNA(Gln) amidotransferase A subunit family amidase